jgi:hypothetical protein
MQSAGFFGLRKQTCHSRQSDKRKYSCEAAQFMQQTESLLNNRPSFLELRSDKKSFTARFGILRWVVIWDAVLQITLTEVF